MLKIGHEVTRPGRNIGEAPVVLPIPEELETTPGIPLTQREVDWYAREYPLESINITERASRNWARTFPPATATTMAWITSISPLVMPVSLATPEYESIHG